MMAESDAVETLEVLTSVSPLSRLCLAFVSPLSRLCLAFVPPLSLLVSPLSHLCFIDAEEILQVCRFSIESNVFAAKYHEIHHYAELEQTSVLSCELWGCQVASRFISLRRLRTTLAPLLTLYVLPPQSNWRAL
jgi:hypothetical protein